jgi:hypothetical protein
MVKRLVHRERGKGEIVKAKPAFFLTQVPMIEELFPQ